MGFDADTALDAVREELPDAVVEEFSIIGTRAGDPRYAAFARSARGGRLDIVVSGDGEVLEVPLARMCPSRPPGDR